MVMDRELIIERIMNDLNVKREIANVYYSDLEKLPIDLKEKLIVYLKTGIIPDCSESGVSINDILSKGGTSIYTAFLHLNSFRNNPHLAESFMKLKVRFR